MQKAISKGSRRSNKSVAGTSIQHTNVVARFFDHFAARVTKWAGSSVAFGMALVAVLCWSLLGPVFSYSETWQLVINTGTTIITFLMVFLIQQSQNKDGEALHLKLDELLIALKGADEALVDAEKLDEDKLLALAAACSARARRLVRRQRNRRGRRSKTSPSRLDDRSRLKRTKQASSP